MFKFEDIFRLYTKRCSYNVDGCEGCKLTKACDIVIDRYIKKLAEKY